MKEDMKPSIGIFLLLLLVKQTVIGALQVFKIYFPFPNHKERCSDDDSQKSP